MPFELVRTAEEFFAAPEGRVLSRPHFAYIGASDALLSLVIWGHVADRDVDELIVTLTVGAQKPKRRDALLQMQAISGVDEASLRTLARFMESTIDRSHAATNREAIVRPTPVLRTVQLVPFENSDRLAALLAPSRGRWQGLALAGAGQELTDALDALVQATGVSRVAPIGELQDADATWDDGDPVSLAQRED